MLSLPESWEFKAQLTFGSTHESPKDKEQEEDETMFKVFNTL